MELKHIGKSEFESEVLLSDKKVLVDFYADWCGPCKMMGPVLEAVAGESDEYKIVKVNVDKDSDLAERYNIMSIPALIVFDKGEIYKKSVGAISKSEVIELLK